MVFVAAAQACGGEDGGDRKQAEETSGGLPAATGSFDTLLEQAVKVSYDDLYRSFGTYDGKLVYYRGEVVTANAVDDAAQSMKSGLSWYSSEVSITLTFRGNWVGNVVISYEPPALKVGDFIELIGRYAGLESYPAPDGTISTMPHLIEAKTRVLEAASTP